MKCEDVEALMIDYLDNNLDDNSKREIEKHLETCERCLDELRDSQEVIRMISKDDMVKPDDTLRINFYHMLHSEIKKSKQQSAGIFPGRTVPWYKKSLYRIAAGIALFICGTLLGTIISSGIKKSRQAQTLIQLQSEVSALKKSVMFTMLKDESSSYRIKAVNYADELDTPDENVINVLIRTLNNDKNVNVRLAAAYALSKFAGQPSVSDSLVNSLTLQNDPILQVALINILVERKVRKAVQPIQTILTNENTLEEVKEVAKNGVEMLL